LADSIIGPGIIIDGTVQAEGDLRILGRVLGRVSVSGTLELAPTGSVKSDVVGGRVLVAGMVEGNVTGTERVDLLAGARLLGNVKAPRLTIADGATFRGKVEMDL
jgi:cytoskeletal protein CcmA (bactofilin family)